MGAAVVAIGGIPAFYFALDHFKHIWRNNRLVVIFHVILRNLTLVDFVFLGKEVYAIGLLQ